ncbi:hypothetical protein ACFL4A_04745, partial [bacterium]
IRTREGKETDFLILKNEEPFFLCEAKLTNTGIDKHQFHHSSKLGNIPFVQIVREANILQIKQKNCTVVSAARFFA